MSSDTKVKSLKSPKSSKSPKTSQNLKEAMEDPSKYKDLILKNPKIYNWNDYITYNNLDRSLIIKSGYLPLIKYYFEGKNLYYEDLSFNNEDITLEVFKYFSEQKLEHNPDLKARNPESEYFFIVAFSKRLDILEYIYKSSFLPNNFYNYGVSYVIEHIIKDQNLEALKIVFKYLKANYNQVLEIYEDLDYYNIAKDCTYDIYKFLFTEIKKLSDYNQKELRKGIRDTQVSAKDKRLFFY